MAFHPLADLFPMLAESELSALAADIGANGLREPIVTHEGAILDGRNRYRACRLVDVAPRWREYTGNDPIAYVWSMNGARRHLSAGQLAAVALDFEAAYAEEARARQANSTGGAHPQLTARLPEAAKGEAREKAAAVTGASPRYVSDAKAIRAEAPDLFDGVRAGTVTIPEAKRAIREREREARRADLVAAAATAPNAGKVWRLYQCAVTDLSQYVGEGSVDVIIADPPYPAEYLSVYAALSEFAAYALRPGGSAFVMVGQSYLPAIVNMLAEYLAYHWTLAYLTPGGQAVQLWDRKVNTFWKPVLWFVNGTYDGAWLGDVCRSKVNDNDKRFHGWGQSESGMADLVERASRPGDLVCDPFCGGGTTGAVAVALYRRFIGADVDGESVAMTRGRLAGAVGL